MTRALIVPAAGTGSRLGGGIPKVLAPVDGRPMLDHLLELYAPFVDRFVVVVAPAALPLIASHLAACPAAIEVCVQDRPTGMLDAVLAPMGVIAAAMPDRVWITWCDQIAVRRETLERLAASEGLPPGPAMVMPTSTSDSPYIHLQRDGHGRIARVLHQREGDAMPPRGEGDVGVFSLSFETYGQALRGFARDARTGRRTGERNFLPFIPWLAAAGTVVTFACTEPIEAVGINTPDELARVEAHLRARRLGMRRANDSQEAG